MNIFLFFWVIVSIVLFPSLDDSAYSNIRAKCSKIFNSLLMMQLKLKCMHKIDILSKSLYIYVV